MRISHRLIGIVFLYIVFIPGVSATSSGETLLSMQNKGMYTFYMENASLEDLESSLASGITIIDPDTKKKHTMLIEHSAENPVFYAKPAKLISLYGKLIPAPADIPEGVETRDGLKVSLVEYKFIQSLPEAVQGTISKEKEDVIISASENPRLPFTFEGTYTPGQTLLENAYFPLIEQYLRGVTPNVTLPLRKEAAQIITKDLPKEYDGQFQDLVTMGVSDFTGSTDNRIHNIQTALDSFNGVVIQPGEEFSFNDYLGLVDGSTGYRKELVIKGDRTIPEYGGGVCQVSTTAYRAALEGGLPITERKNHSYAVSYYTPWGSDATVYPGVVDLKFKNDTPGPMIMQAYKVDPKVYFKFYGTKDAREVELNGPYVYNYVSPPAPRNHVVSWLAPGQKQFLEGGVTGFNSHWERIVRYPDQEEPIKETFRSAYEARPNQYYVGAAAPESSEIVPGEEGM